MCVTYRAPGQSEVRLHGKLTLGIASGLGMGLELSLQGVDLLLSEARAGQVFRILVIVVHSMEVELVVFVRMVWEGTGRWVVVVMIDWLQELRRVVVVVMGSCRDTHRVEGVLHRDRHGHGLLVGSIGKGIVHVAHGEQRERPVRPEERGSFVGVLLLDAAQQTSTVEQMPTSTSTWTSMGIVRREQGG